MKKEIIWPKCSQKDAEKVLSVFDRSVIRTKRKLRNALLSTRDNITMSEYGIKSDEAVERLQFYVDQLLSRVEVAKLPSLKNEETKYYDVRIVNNQVALELLTAEEITIEGSEISGMVSVVDGVLISVDAKMLTTTEYADLYGLSNTKVERLLDKGLFFSSVKTEKGVLISELELPSSGEPGLLFYDIPKDVTIDCPLLPAINLSTSVIIEYDEDTKKHKCKLRNWDTHFEQSFKLTKKEVNEIRKSLNSNPYIDTSENGNLINVCW